jgi:hypothetical protein
MGLEPTVWIVGDWRQAEFGEAITWLRGIVRCLLFDDGYAAISSLHMGEGGLPPTAILVVQARPGQFSRHDLEQLHAAAPLARLVALLGAWCDGQMRSGQPWPGVVRLPLSNWRFGLDHELGLDVRNGRWRLPRTANEVERIESTLRGLHRNGIRVARAIVLSSRRANYEAIADLLQQIGLESLWQSQADCYVEAVDVMVFDGWEQVARVWQRETDHQVGFLPPRILLVHFPREEDYARAAREGIAEVVKVPLLLPDLATALNNVR